MKWKVVGVHVCVCVWHFLQQQFLFPQIISDTSHNSIFESKKGNAEDG